MRQFFRLAAFPSITVWLISCSILPATNKASTSSNQVPVQRANFQQASDSAAKQETVTFPSMVKTTELENAKPDQTAQLNEALDRAKSDNGTNDFAVSGLQLPVLQIVRFMTKATNFKQQIKISETASFRLVIEMGNKFEILDGNATDGEAKLRLTKNTYETLLHLEGPWKPDSSLDVEDSLYYVKDNLSSKQGKLFDINRWFLVGLRPIPVPADWRSPDGQSFVLNFKSQKVQEFQIAWWSSNQTVAFPPGIQQIGPNGGVVELPGVARVAIFKDSVQQPVVISIRQITEAPNFPYDQNSTPLAQYASPVIKMEPMDVIFKNPILIDLAVYKDLMGNIPIQRTQWVRATQINSYSDWTKKIISVLWDYYPSFTYELGYISRILPTNNQNGFSTKQLGPVSQLVYPGTGGTGGILTGQSYTRSGNIVNFYDGNVGVSEHMGDYIDIAEYANEVFHYYDSISRKKPNVWYYSEPTITCNGVKIPFDPFYSNIQNITACKNFNYILDPGVFDGIAINTYLTAADANPFTHLSVVIPGLSYINLPLPIHNQSDTKVLTSEAIGHELWHVYQFSGVFYTALTTTLKDKGWIIEGSAEAMSKHVYYQFPKHYSNINPNNTAMPEHFKYLQHNQSEIDASNSLHFPQSDNGYSTSAFFELLVNYSGVQVLSKISDFITDVFSSPKVTSAFQVSELIKNKTNLDLNLIYPEYILKSATGKLFDYLSLNDSFNLRSTLISTITVKEIDVNNPSIIDEINLSPLSSKLYLVKNVNSKNKTNLLTRFILKDKNLLDKIQIKAYFFNNGKTFLSKEIPIPFKDLNISPKFSEYNNEIPSFSLIEPNFSDENLRIMLVVSNLDVGGPPDNDKANIKVEILVKPVLELTSVEKNSNYLNLQGYGFEPGMLAVFSSDKANANLCLSLKNATLQCSSGIVENIQTISGRQDGLQTANVKIPIESKNGFLGLISQGRKSNLVFVSGL